jgi:DNA-directed RNA polymerase specialized sigma24 family protein
VERKVSGVTSRSVQSGEQEIELITQAQQGDRGAFGQLVRRHREGVVNVVYRMCGDANLAEDVAQEAFIRAWQHLHSYRPQSPFRNWLYRIATNLALDVLRRERETVDIDALALAASDNGPEAVAEGEERGERVRQAVMLCRRPVVRCWYCGSMMGSPIARSLMLWVSPWARSCHD